MKSICFFCSYYSDGSLPFYVRFYLNELCNHFTEVVLLTNEKTMLPEDMQFLQSKNIPYRIYKNEGYDFGMWHKAFLEFDIKNYDRVALVNDSCILFNKLDFYFDWLNKQDLDYSGLTDCMLHNYHIQSYFIIINKKAIPHTLKYFETKGIISDMMQLIKTYEIGLTMYLKNAGMNIAAYYSFKDKIGIGNPSWMKAKNLIREGYPLVKKKIIIRYYGIADWKSLVANGFDPYPSHYIRLIKKTVPAINMAELLAGLPLKKPFNKELKFHTIAILSWIYGLFKKVRHLIKVIVFYIVRTIYRTFVPERKDSKVKNFLYRILH